MSPPPTPDLTTSRALATAQDGSRRLALALAASLARTSPPRAFHARALLLNACAPPSRVLAPTPSLSRAATAHSGAYAALSRRVALHSARSCCVAPVRAIYGPCAPSPARSRHFPPPGVVSRLTAVSCPCAAVPHPPARAAVTHLNDTVSRHSGTPSHYQHAPLLLPPRTPAPPPPAATAPSRCSGAAAFASLAPRSGAPTLPTPSLPALPHPSARPRTPSRAIKCPLLSLFRWRPVPLPSHCRHAPRAVATRPVPPLRALAHPSAPLASHAPIAISVRLDSRPAASRPITPSRPTACARRALVLRSVVLRCDMPSRPLWDSVASHHATSTHTSHRIPRWMGKADRQGITPAAITCRCAAAPPHPPSSPSFVFATPSRAAVAMTSCALALPLSILGCLHAPFAAPSRRLRAPSTRCRAVAPSHPPSSPSFAFATTLPPSRRPARPSNDAASASWGTTRPRSPARVHAAPLALTPPRAP
ncbi:hypothetical protein DENSPDRAFT_934575 [Dentipellis sp. KUC8613]|nr:hypothetical protein DENSPDRAFT_934575 [Dentipellis sp. KUC8613]